MQRQSFVMLTLVILGAFLLVGIAVAQVSPNFDLHWYSAGNGGSQRNSGNFRVEDALGQTAADTVASANFVVEAGFMAGFSSSAPTSTPGPTPTNTPEAQAGGDGYEDNDVCTRAKPIPIDGSLQEHTFHDSGDSDWLTFTAEAGKSYRIRIENVSAQSDAVVNLFDVCNLTLLGSGSNSFGSETILEWDAVKNGAYFFQVQQFDAAQFGNDVNYRVSVTVDNVLPCRPATRCSSLDANTLGIQWQKNPERDIQEYRAQYQGDKSGIQNLFGAGATFAQIGELTTGQSYTVRVTAVDFSGNRSTPTDEFSFIIQTPVDTTQPVLSLTAPEGGTVVTTTSSSLTFVGLATDAGNNLSRVRIRNATVNLLKEDSSLTGGSDTFRIEDLSLQVGDNVIELTAFDEASNASAVRTLTVKRQGNAQGAVLIVAGRNETNSLQSNIYNAANRAYRIFKTAGFSDDAIYYIAPTQQDADKDGLTDDVDATPANPTALQNAIVTWANGKVGPGQPLFVYMIDHGFEDKFCVDGCATGAITPALLNEWLNTLEANTGVDQVTVVIEACLSGSFITRAGGADANSLAKPGRVIITSTSDNKNAYASAEGAYFSDAFFSCIADSQDLKTCFEEGRAAVATTGVSQFPQLDDNADAVYNSGDGAVAQTRFVTRFFGTLRPTIQDFTVNRQGTNGTLLATVKEGAEELDVVWAAIYPPGFVEPQGVTLNLNVPTVRLEPDPAAEGQYRFNYINGFTAEGDYRIVLYAQDRLGIHATPKRVGDQAGGIYLPLIHR
ncbi:MAG: C13 family peptidase [Caldilineaceae bacterium]